MTIQAFLLFSLIGPLRAATIDVVAVSTEVFSAQQGVLTVSQSFSGQYLATGGKDGAVTIWDVPAHRVQSAFRGHNEAVTALAFSSSGGLLASASLDATIHIWNVVDGKLIRTLSGHSSGVNSVAFSKSDEELVSASSDKSVRIWHVADGKAVRILRGSTGEVYSAAFSPEGDMVAATGEDAVIRLWRARDGALLWKTRAGFTNVQYAVAFSPAGQMLAAGGEDSRIRYLRVSDGVVTKTSQGGTGPVLALSFSRSGDQLVSAGKDGAVRSWRVSDAELLKQFDGHKGAVASVSSPNDAGLFASAGGEGTVRLWTLPRIEDAARFLNPPIIETPLPVSTTEQAAIDAELNTLPDYRTTRPNAYAVIIGIERYRDLIGAEYASRDAKLVRRYFEKALGIPAEHILLRQDDRASLGDLQGYFETWLKEKVTAGSEVFVYYSGHGTPNPKTGESSIVPYDALPETLQDGGYPLKRLYAVLGALPIKRALVILDSCFSGSGGPRTVLAQGVRPIIPVVEDEALASGKVAVISAASGSEISGTHRAARHGLLTYYMIRGLRGEAAGKDGKISLIDLYSYLLPKVIVDARNSHREQEPKLLPSASVSDPWSGETLANLSKAPSEK